MTDRLQKDLYETKEFYLLFVLIIIYLIYSWTNNYLIVGLDFKYYLLVRFLPFFIGLLAFGLIKYKRLKFIYKNDKIRKDKKALIGLYVFLCIVFSFFTFNLVASIIWIEKIKKDAKNKPIEYYDCVIEKISSHRNRKSVLFVFKEKKEYVKISLEEFKYHIDENVEKLFLKIEVRKSFDNYYIVDKWKISN